MERCGCVLLVTRSNMAAVLRLQALGGLRSGLLVRCSSQQVRCASSTIQLVKQVRERTGAGIMDCKKALEANNMDVEAATQALASEARVAVGRAGRTTTEGCLGAAKLGRTAVLCELQSETDFVAKMEDFRRLAASAAVAGLQAGAAVAAEGTPVQLENSEVLKGTISDGSGTVEEAISKMIFSTKETISLKKALAVQAKEGGAVGVYLHGIGKQAAVVALEAKDSTASVEQLEKLATDIAIHIVASSPKVLAKEDIVEGEHKADDALLEQEFIMDSGSVAEAVSKAGASVKSFVHALQGQ